MPKQIAGFNIDRALFLFDEVYQDSAEKVVSGIMAMSATGPEDIFLFINSMGGEVSSMNAIIDAMNYVPNHIVTIVFGEADSAAAIISSSGERGKRIIGSRSNVMIHEVSKGIWGTLSEIEDSLKRGKEISDKLFTQLAKNTGKDKAYIEELVKGKDVWMNATEAIAFGMADASIADDKEDLLEILFDTTQNSAGEKHLNLAGINSDSFKEFNKKIDRFVVIKDSNKNKEGAMPGDKTTDTAEISVVSLPAEKLTNLVARIDQLTSETTEANRAKANAEAELNKFKIEAEADKASLNSRLKVLEEEKETSRLAEVNKAIGTFKEVALKVIPKEVLDELSTILETNKVGMDVVLKLTEAINKATPLVPNNTKIDSTTNKIVSSPAVNEELKAMSPA